MRRVASALVALVALFSTAVPANAVVDNVHSPCDALLVQYIAQTYLNVTKTFGYSAYSGSTTCFLMRSGAWIDLLGTKYYYEWTELANGASTYYVHTPYGTGNGAYGKPDTANHGGICNPCSARLDIQYGAFFAAFTVAY